MSNEQGISECLLLLQAVKDLALDAKSVLADGKVDLHDLPVAVTLLGQLGELTAAVEGIGQVPAEIKDLSPEEITQLAAKALEIVQAFKAA